MASAASGLASGYVALSSPLGISVKSGQTMASMFKPWSRLGINDGFLKKRLSTPFFEGVQGVRQSVQPKQASVFHGLPEISFSEVVIALASPFALSPVGNGNILGVPKTER